MQNKDKNINDDEKQHTLNNLIDHFVVNQTVNCQ